MEDVSKTTIFSLLDTRESRRSGRIVKVLDRFMFLGEVVSNKHDLDPNRYNNAISDKYLRNWQNTMKVNDNVYAREHYGFIGKGQERMVCKLYKSIFRLKQASRSSNIHFDQAIKYFFIEQNTNEPCVYKKCKRSVVIFLIHR